MLIGIVNGNLEATIRFPIRDVLGQEHEIEAILDTGFSGALTLPQSLITKLGLPWRSCGSAILANGAIDQFDIYVGTIIWDGTPRNILVEESNTEPLVGMTLIGGFELRIQGVIGGMVEIDPLP